MTDQDFQPWTESPEGYYDFTTQITPRTLNMLADCFRMLSKFKGRSLPSERSIVVEQESRTLRGAGESITLGDLNDMFNARIQGHALRVEPGNAGNSTEERAWVNLRLVADQSILEGLVNMALKAVDEEIVRIVESRGSKLTRLEMVTIYRDAKKAGEDVIVEFLEDVEQTLKEISPERAEIFMDDPKFIPTSYEKLEELRTAKLPDPEGTPIPEGAAVPPLSGQEVPQITFPVEYTEDGNWRPKTVHKQSKVAFVYRTMDDVREDLGHMTTRDLQKRVCAVRKEDSFTDPGVKSAKFIYVMDVGQLFIANVSLSAHFDRATAPGKTKRPSLIDQKIESLRDKAERNGEVTNWQVFPISTGGQQAKNSLLNIEAAQRWVNSLTEQKTHEPGAKSVLQELVDRAQRIEAMLYSGDAIIWSMEERKFGFVGILEVNVRELMSDPGLPVVADDSREMVAVERAELRSIYDTIGRILGLNSEDEPVS